MRHPFQCIASLQHGGLIAACGPRLLVYGLNSRGIISEWSSRENTSNSATTGLQNEAEAERPAKKQKANAPPKAPNIIKLAVAEDQKHAVAVTDDKAIRVFALVEWKLQELSQRVMPKRPCAIQILPDSATILCADKFGDVYSLPLLSSAALPDMAASDAQTLSPQPEARFKPSASTSTVHSQRNRQALEAQMKQTNFTPRKDPLTFEHKLLLGHVSMLTDMKYIEHPRNINRAYILTADRDEHIRVSRAPPQSHIIEGFCLGHTSFISKICKLEQTNLLVSGGGDTWLGVWEWPNFKLRNKLDLLKYVREIPGHDEDDQLAISGIWSTSIDANHGQTQEPLVMVACEKVNALFLIARSVLLADYSQPEGHPLVLAVHFPGCPLDVTVANGESIVVSLDVRKEEEVDFRVQSLWPRKRGGCDDPTASIEIRVAQFDGNDFNQVLKSLNSYTSPDVTSSKELDEFLYGVANLRKRGHQEGEEAQDEANGD